MDDGTARPDATPPSADSTAFYRTLADNASEGMMTIDTDHRIVYANAAMTDILGYEPEELVGSSKLRVIPERLRPVHRDALESYIQTSEKNIDWNEIELPALHKDGHEVPTFISLHEHEHSGQRLFTGIIREISERRKRERMLQRRNEQLNSFAEIISHDIKNPLAVAKGYTEMAREDHDIEELAEIATALDRIEELIDDVLVRSREGAVVGELESISLERSVQETWRTIETEDAMLRIDQELGTVCADRSRLQELLSNVFSNAVAHADDDVTLFVGLLPGGSGFYIEDDGPGIPSAIRGDVFEHGYSTTEDGTGYGLSIVDRIADAHGWTVGITEGRNNGARFEVTGVSMST
jgi:two-component system, LuxR family, sensor kinase FixL